jgi:hypothetical protein
MVVDDALLNLPTAKIKNSSFLYYRVRFVQGLAGRPGEKK